VAHLCDTDDHVLDHRLDGSETGNVLSVSVPDSEDDLVGLWLLNLEVVGQLVSREARCSGGWFSVSAGLA
jgi:hypothetical protein